MTEAKMYEKSFYRPHNFFKLSSREQWAIDKKLGILDWNGGCTHNSTCCKECDARFKEHYNQPYHN